MILQGGWDLQKLPLYKHYTSKQEILDRIVERMNEMDHARAEVYEMPETEPDGFAEAYLNTPSPELQDDVPPFCRNYEAGRS